MCEPTPVQQSSGRQKSSKARSSVGGVLCCAPALRGLSRCLPDPCRSSRQRAHAGQRCSEQSCQCSPAGPDYLQAGAGQEMRAREHEPHVERWEQ